MAATEGSGCSSKIICFYETRVFIAGNPIAAAAAAPIAAAAASDTPSSSSYVVFKVQCFLRFSVEGHPKTEFLEEKNWRETRQSRLELPWSADGLIIDDLKISETLTVLRVPKVSHQSIMDQLCLGAASVGLASMIVVEICEVTHVTLPVINEEGKKIIEEYEEEEIVDEDEIVDHNEVVPVPDDDDDEMNKQEINDEECFNSLKKLILDVGDNNVEDEVSIIDWNSKFIAAAYRIALPVTWEEGAKEVEKERTCPICMEIFKQDEKRSKMLCCPQVFHCDCISIWTKRGKTCPWCRSSLPLVVQSAKGFIHRHESDYFSPPLHPGFFRSLVIMWYLLGEWAIWSKVRLHPLGCECGCDKQQVEVIVA